MDFLGWKSIFLTHFHQKKYLINTINTSPNSPKNENEPNKKKIYKLSMIYLHRQETNLKPSSSNLHHPMKIVDTKNDKCPYRKVAQLITLSLLIAFKQVSLSSL